MKYKIKDYSIIEENGNFFLVGTSDHYQDGKLISTSKLISVNFELGIAITQNSVYHLVNEF